MTKDRNEWLSRSTLESPTIAYRVTLTPPVDHVLKKMTAASPDQRAIYDWLGLVIARLGFSRTGMGFTRPG